MKDETNPVTIYSEADIEKFLMDITDPVERAEKEAFFKGFGELGEAMNKSHALRKGVPKALSDEPTVVVDQIVDGVSEVATRITG